MDNDRIMNTKGEKGFTLIEVITVSFIISVMIGVAVPTYFGLLRETNMNTTTNQIITDIRKAQARSMATGEGYGYQFTNDSGSYDYIKDGDPAETLEVRSLSNQVTVLGTTFTGDKVTFFRSGAASESGTVIIKYSDGATKSIEVTKITGKASLQ